MENKATCVCFPPKKFKPPSAPVVSLNDVGVEFVDQVEYHGVLLHEGLQ